jgi:type I restriction enzyme S subunit
MNATLEVMARALFRDWFVDFGPTHAKMEGRTPYLSPDLWSLFPDRLDPEGKPEGWEVGTMSDLFTLQRGFDLPSQDRRDGKYPILAASGPSGYHESHMVKGPGVTTGRSGVLGRVFYVHGDFWPLNTSLWVKDYKRATPLYAYQFLSLIDLAGFNAGSAVPTLNRNHVHGLPAVLPPPELVVAFDQLADGLMKRHRHNEIEIETLAQTRDLLLPRLMSGDLRVAEAERAVEAVL